MKTIKIELKPCNDFQAGLLDGYIQAISLIVQRFKDNNKNNIATMEIIESKND